MDIDKHLEATTKAVHDQIDANKASITNALDAADRIIMQKAVDATIRLAQTPLQPDPT